MRSHESGGDVVVYLGRLWDGTIAWELWVGVGVGFLSFGPALMLTPTVRGPRTLEHS